MTQKEVIKTRISAKNVILIRAKIRLSGLTISGYLRGLVLRDLELGSGMTNVYEESGKIDKDVIRKISPRVKVKSVSKLSWQDQAALRINKGDNGQD